MLILTRRPGEAIRIGYEIEVTILSQKGDQFRVGIAAHREIPVHRKEVYQRIKDEKVA